MRFTRNLFKGGGVAALAAFIIVLSFSPEDESIADRVVSLVLERTGSMVCTGVLISEKVVLSASHCMEDFERNAIRVRSRSGSLYSLKSIRSHPTPSYLFPSGDILRIELEKPVILAQELKPLSFVDPDHWPIHGKMNIWGFDEFCKEDCARMRKASLSHPIDGLWLRSLLLVKAEKDGFCFGDSGGPAFVYKAGEWQLLGLVSGKMDMVNGDDLSCANRDVILTAVASYKEWIENPDSFGSPSYPVSHDFAELCQRPLAESASLIYAILLDLASHDIGLSRQDKIDLLSTCKNADQIFKRRLRENPRFHFDSPLQLQWIDGFEQIKALDLPNPMGENRKILEEMNSLTHVESSDPMNLKKF